MKVIWLWLSSSVLNRAAFSSAFESRYFERESGYDWAWNGGVELALMSDAFLELIRQEINHLAKNNPLWDYT